MSERPVTAPLVTEDTEPREDGGNRERARINARLLALFVLAIYIGFIGVNAFRSFAG